MQYQQPSYLYKASCFWGINLAIASSIISPSFKKLKNSLLKTIKPPFSFSFIPQDLENLQGTNQLKLISYDVVDNESETDSTFIIGQ